MALSYVGAGTDTEPDGANLSASLPGTIAEDDIVVVASADGVRSDVNKTMTTSGYTEVADIYANGGTWDQNLGVFYKIMGATPDSTADAPGTGDTFRDASLIAYVVRGVDTTTPIDATTTTATNNAASNPDSPSITTVTNDAWVLAIGATPGAGTLAGPSGYSNFVSAVEQSSTNFSVSGVAQKEVATAGAENPPAFTGMTEDTDDGWCAATVALRPAGGGVSISVPQGNLTFSASAPSVDVTNFGNPNITVPQGDLALETHVPIAIAPAGGAEIKVQRVQDNIGNSGGTNTGFTAVSALSAAFEHNSNNRLTHSGSTSSTGNMEGDDMSGGIELTGTGTLTYYRQSGSLAQDMHFAAEIIEYLGSGGGDNEFIVRSRNTVAFTATSTTATLDNTVTDIDKCICFVVRQQTTETVDNFDVALCTAHLTNTTTLQVTKNANTGGAVTCGVVVVEFTGSNWTVFHSTVSSTADSGTMTLNDQMDIAGSTGDVSNWATAVIFGQINGSSVGAGNDDAIADTSARWAPGSGTTTVDWDYDAQHVAATNQAQRIYVLKHPDMVVTRFTSTTSHQGDSNVDITSAGLTDLEQAMVVISRTSSGTGTAYGRGWVDARYTSLTNVAMWAHRTGNTINTEIQVVDFSGISGAGGANVYREVPKGDLVLSPTAPTADTTTGGGTDITVPQGGLVFDAQAPSVGQTENRDISVPQGDLVLGSQAPSANATENRDVTVPQGDLALSSEAPGAAQTENVGVEVPQGDLTLSTTAPSIVWVDNHPIEIPNGNLILTTTAPSAVRTQGQTIEVPAGNLLFSANAPVVVWTDHHLVTVPGGNLTFTSQAPDVTSSSAQSIVIPQADLLFSTSVPAALRTTNVEIVIASGDLLFSTFAPLATLTSGELAELKQRGLLVNVGRLMNIG